MEYLYINNQNSVAVTYNPESIVEDVYINRKKMTLKMKKILIRKHMHRKQKENFTIIF